jgi:hypothetical protein
MKLKDALIVWTPKSYAVCSTWGQIDVLDTAKGYWDDDSIYKMSAGASSAQWEFATDSVRLNMMFDLFHRTLILRCEMDFKATHEAFLKIDEYALAMCAFECGADCVTQRPQRQANAAKNSKIQKST